MEPQRPRGMADHPLAACALIVVEASRRSTTVTRGSGGETAGMRGSGFDAAEFPLR